MVNILIFKEKHSERYYDVSTPEKRAEAFLMVLRERNEYAYFEPKKETIVVSVEDQTMLNLTEEQIDALPDELKNYTINRRDAINGNLIYAESEYNTEKKWWDAVQEMLALPKEEAIKKFYVNNYKRKINYVEYLVELHSDYEYEGYDFEETEN